MTATPLRRTACLLLVACGLALPAAAQLDLPEKSAGRGQQGTEPPAEGTGETAQPGELPVVTPDGNPPVELKPLSSSKNRATRGPERGKGGLDLPASAPESDARGHAAHAPSTGAAPAPAADAGTAPEEALPGRAGFILAELARARRADSTVAREAADGLAALGEEGLAAARVALADDHLPTLTTGARVLLRAGSAADRELVVVRLRGPLPPRSADTLLEVLVDRAPDRATDALLVELLDHPQQMVRSAADRRLRDRVSPETLTLLAGALASERSDTRLRALELATSVDDPAVLNILLDALEDPAAKVAHSATLALAWLDDERVEAALVHRAFRDPLLLRTAAYALLAIVEREDRLACTLLDGTYVPVLLENLQVSRPLTSGAAACALAGLGFRGETGEDGNDAWLDREVPHMLVRTVSAAEYHSDYSSIQGTAERRLSLLSGQSFGSDGQAWQRWWVQAAPDFRARRAHLAIQPEDVGAIELRYRDPARGIALRLVGPSAPSVPGSPSAGGVADLAPGELFFLTEEEAADVVALLRREGVLGPERLPGVRGAPTSERAATTPSAAAAARPAGGSGSATVRVLEVRARAGDKRFGFGSGLTEPWFDRVGEMAVALAERNHWQRYPDPALHADRHALWREQHEWWRLQDDPAARDLRLKGLLLAALPAIELYDRDGAVAELEELLGRPGVADASDFTPLLELLRQEPFYGERAAALARLAREAARLASAPAEVADAADGAAPDVRIEAGLGRQLVEVLLVGFGADAAPDLVELLAASEDSLLFESARAERPFLRAVAAAALARRPDEPAFALLLDLLADEDPAVECATVLALGEHRVEAARDELLIRARIADSEVRAAALEAIGRMGGAGVVDPLLLGLASDDPLVRLAAADGLADLADPSTTRALIELLELGARSPFAERAREGLLRIGAPARPDLIRLCRTARAAGRREAALILAVEGVPDAASTLMTVLTEDPGDVEVARELAVLTCVDLRGAADPAQAWWEWWDQVVHDDPIAWLRAGLERLGIPAPPAGSFGANGTPEGGRCLRALLDRPEGWLVERARRELARLLEIEVAAVPAHAGERAAWAEALGALVDRHFEQ